MVHETATLVMDQLNKRCLDVHISPVLPSFSSYPFQCGRREVPPDPLRLRQLFWLSKEQTAHTGSASLHSRDVCLSIWQAELQPHLPKFVALRSVKSAYVYSRRVQFSYLWWRLSPALSREIQSEWLHLVYLPNLKNNSVFIVFYCAREDRMWRDIWVCVGVCVLYVIGAAVWKYGALFSPKAYVSEGGRQRNKIIIKIKKLEKIGAPMVIQQVEAD